MGTMDPNGESPLKVYGNDVLVSIAHGKTKLNTC